MTQFYGFKYKPFAPNFRSSYEEPCVRVDVACAWVCVCTQLICGVRQAKSTVKRERCGRAGVRRTRVDTREMSLTRQAEYGEGRRKNRCNEGTLHNKDGLQAKNC